MTAIIAPMTAITMPTSVSRQGPSIALAFNLRLSGRVSCDRELWVVLFGV